MNRQDPGIRELELLAPAANKEIAIQAILHGADAVYIGASSHGARKKAGNSIEDIAEVVEFAHKFRAKVYVTVNTLVYDNEIIEVQDLITALYRAGVDAIIVQDMSILRMNIPPVEFHASTQCDTRTVEKAKFLNDIGFSQIVLARELSLPEIRVISENVDAKIECFVHGALCVSYSGRCQASQACLGRSANRGECAQLCRYQYTLKNGKGEDLIKNRYLLSLKDLNLSDNVEDLIEAGVSSFKIEGRLKDVSYVKNITAYYRNKIDEVIARYPHKYKRASVGESHIYFKPVLDKSFNRGFTTYFMQRFNRNHLNSPLTPKSLGEVIDNPAQLNNGDGISFFNAKGEYEGVRVNRVAGNKIIGQKIFTLPKNSEIHRTFDRVWEQNMLKNTATRTIGVSIILDESGASISDERGVYCRLPLDCDKSLANHPMNPITIFSKLGGTIYSLQSFENRLNPTTFIPASQLTALRRRLIEQLDLTSKTTYKFNLRKPEDHNAKYPSEMLDSTDNVANKVAEKFYREHGVQSIKFAIEVENEFTSNSNINPSSDTDRVVMTTRYCLRKELGWCKKDKYARIPSNVSEPLFLVSDNNKFRLVFDCKNCEMKVIK